MAQKVKNLPPIQEKHIPSLGWEDSPGGGNGNPLQYSCLENFMDRRAWRAAVYWVTESWTRLSMNALMLQAKVVCITPGTLRHLLKSSLTWWIHLSCVFFFGVSKCPLVQALVGIYRKSGLVLSCSLCWPSRLIPWNWHRHLGHEMT